MGFGACNDVSSKGFFQDLHFTPNQIPKTDPKRRFFPVSVQAQGSLLVGLLKGSLRGPGPDLTGGSADFSWEPSLKGAKSWELGVKYEP